VFYLLSHTLHVFDTGMCTAFWFS